MVKWPFLIYQKASGTIYNHNVSSRMLRFEMHGHILWHLESPISNQDKKINPTTQRQGEMLVVTRLGVSSFHLSLCSKLEQVLVFVDGRSIFLPKDSGEGRICIRSRFQSLPWVCVHILCVIVYDELRHLVFIVRPMQAMNARCLLEAAQGFSLGRSLDTYIGSYKIQDIR